MLDAILGGWELNTINTAHTGTPLNVYYTPATANAVSGLSNDYRGEPFLRPNVTGSATSQSKSQLINTYFAGYTFTTPPANAPFGNLGRNAFRAPGLEQWDWRRTRLPFRREGQAAVPLGVLQSAQPHQLRNSEHELRRFGVRHDPRDVSGAADPVRAEGDFLATVQAPGCPW